MDNEKLAKTDLIAMNQVQLILAEKRTSLAVMRTGIAVLLLPMSIISFLIATSELYDILKVIYLLLPLGIMNFALLVFGIYLIIRSKMRMRKQDDLIYKIKLKHGIIAEFIETS